MGYLAGISEMNNSMRDSANKVQVTVRPMLRRDADSVLAIEQEAFDCPWMESDFVRVLRQRLCFCMVAERGLDIAGFMIYELQKTRIHVLNFAVAKAYRRQGVGRQMVAELGSLLPMTDGGRIVLEVRERNLSAQLFWKAMDFRAVKVLSQHYDNGETAYRFASCYRSKQLTAARLNAVVDAFNKYVNSITHHRGTP
jgi:ribosomal-protein-alanine N-acetyltransferase